MLSRAGSESRLCGNAVTEYSGAHVIQSRFYNIDGARWEARFFQKGECFPDTGRTVPKQGIWASLAGSGWDRPCFVGYSWKTVRFDPDVLYLPERDK